MPRLADWGRQKRAGLMMTLDRALFVRGWGLGGTISRLQYGGPCHVVRLHGHLRRAVSLAGRPRHYRVGHQRRVQQTL